MNVINMRFLLSQRRGVVQLPFFSTFYYYYYYLLPLLHFFYSSPSPMFHDSYLFSFCTSVALFVRLSFRRTQNPFRLCQFFVRYASLSLSYVSKKGQRNNKNKRRRLPKLGHFQFLYNQVGCSDVWYYWLYLINAVQPRRPRTPIYDCQPPMLN